ncbi:ATP-binding cassette domain-containing protein [Eubacterium oxidoreducens]|uniref:Putative ABC transport system ATP-binding protein n=1 Tax=Eubacterium oxidoreducens TaxID=1732 RepID=A0A1G6AKI9_EUBOX|nr:ATP-binding cassette domain-containing protein [Eubacterium oxidoreducens]SDB08948.1 putative ABC transport system ATP-binding protein [Eubacterium oxidoreducens]
MRDMITISELCFQYKNKEIFKKLSYEFHEGRYIIQGENGGGKSTLLNLISGYLQPDSGYIKTNDLVINYLFQEPMIFNNLTVYENIMLKCIAIESEEKEELIQRYADKFNLRDKLKTKVGLLSGGERQRVQLAILSCSSADVIMMDEPIANLDKKNSEEIMKYIFSLECPLVIVVSHQYIKKTSDYTLLELKEGELIEV